MLICFVYIFELTNRFNRYMVECESKICFFQFLDEISFNRYMVECECYSENICKDF